MNASGFVVNETYTDSPETVKKAPPPYDSTLTVNTSEYGGSSRGESPHFFLNNTTAESEDHTDHSDLHPVHISQSVPVIRVDEELKNEKNEEAEKTIANWNLNVTIPSSKINSRPLTLTIPQKLLTPFAKLPSLLTRSRASTPVNQISPGYLNPYYEAESPDELALVYAASAYGFRLVKRQLTSATVEFPGKNAYEKKAKIIV